jgi:hypothetical protein
MSSYIGENIWGFHNEIVTKLSTKLSTGGSPTITRVEGVSSLLGRAQVPCPAGRKKG